MTQLIANIIDGYYDILGNKSDPRVNKWPMMSSPIPTIGISIFYAIFVTKIGPRLMKNRKPFDLNTLLIVYNAIQVAISAWIFYEVSVSGWLTFYSFRCQPIDWSDNPIAVRMAGTCWWYYISKFTELFDTLFFVLRKKFDHISMLHVIHHGIMPVTSWAGVKFLPGGHATFFGFLNTFVHVIMYSYYMLAALGPKVQPYLWWKKYLTLLQIVQFILILVHSSQSWIFDCDVSKTFQYITLSHGGLFLVLFINFYGKSYRAAKAKAAKGLISETKNGQSEFKKRQNGRLTSAGDSLRQRRLS